MTTEQVLTLADLIAMLRESAGVEEGVDLDDAKLDTPFIDLGYDSLAVLQVMGRVKRERGINVPDDAVVDAETPRELLALIGDADQARSAA